MSNVAGRAVCARRRARRRFPRALRTLQTLHLAIACVTLRTIAAEWVTRGTGGYATCDRVVFRGSTGLAVGIRCLCRQRANQRSRAHGALLVAQGRLVKAHRTRSAELIAQVITGITQTRVCADTPTARGETRPRATRARVRGHRAVRARRTRQTRCAGQTAFRILPGTTLSTRMIQSGIYEALHTNTVLCSFTAARVAVF